MGGYLLDRSRVWNLIEQNKLTNQIETGMGTQNRLTAVRGEGESGTGRKTLKGLVKEHICIIHKHRQQCGDGWREKGE